MLLFTPSSTYTSIDNYTMEDEHYSSQLFLWLFVLRTVTRLAFLPPAEEEADYLPALPGKLWRHDYIVRDGFFKEKAYAVDRFWSREDGVDVVHNDLLIATPLKEMTSTRVGAFCSIHMQNLRMLISLLEEYDWSLLHFSTQVLTVLNK